MSAILAEFDYKRPKTLEEALELMAQNKNYALLAGGTDLICAIKENHLSPSLLVDIKSINELKIIKDNGDSIEVGSLVTFTEIIESELLQRKLPLLVESSMTVASSSVRNRATLVGNISSAVPCMDSGAPLIAHDATITILGQEGERTIPLVEWFVAPRKTAIKKGEIVTKITFLNLSKSAGTSYIKLGRYTGEDLAQASVAVIKTDRELRIAFGSLSAVPVRAKSIEKFLAGLPLTKENLEKAKLLVTAEIAPITDIRATKEYREHMAKVMLERALLCAEDRFEGRGPKLGTQLL